MDPPPGLTPADMGLMDFEDVFLTPQVSSRVVPSVTGLLTSVPAFQSITTTSMAGGSGLGRPLSAIPGLEEFQLPPQPASATALGAGFGSTVQGITAPPSSLNSKVGLLFHFLFFTLPDGRVKLHICTVRNVCHLV